MHSQRTHEASRVVFSGIDQTTKERFRRTFQKSLRQCIRHRFCLEESFGMVFAEVGQLIRVSPDEEAELFAELLDWAKRNQKLFTHSGT